MGEVYLPLIPSYNRSVHIHFRDEWLTSDAGMLVVREALDRLGLIEWLVERLEDPRSPAHVQHPLSELLRARLLMLTLGWQDANDVDLLRQDPAFRLAASDRRGDRALRDERVPSVSSMVRLSAMLSSDPNLLILEQVLVTIAARSRRGRVSDRKPVMLDVDSLPVRVHGQQPGSAYNGQYGYRAFHPIVATLGEEGDMVAAWLRPGNAHTAHGADELIPDLVRQLEQQVAPVRGVRLDAGFPSGRLLAVLDQQGIRYLARIRSNAVLDRLAGWCKLPMMVPPEKEPRYRFTELRYKAGSWTRERRVVHVHIQDPDDLVGRDFFLVTSFSAEELTPEDLLWLYRRRGTAEDAFGQWVNAVRPVLSSTNRPKSHVRGQPVRTPAELVDATAVNQVHLLLSVLACNLLVAMRRVAAVEGQPRPRLDRFRNRVLKVGARAVLTGRRVQVSVAGSARRAWLHLWAALQAFEPELLDTS